VHIISKTDAEQKSSQNVLLSKVFVVDEVSVGEEDNLGKLNSGATEILRISRSKPS
jgi:hypothetical protein